MPKCSKAKNPCKICLGQVTTKTGLQCQGACQTWMHFTCLNYTPGKIKDIKAGIIKVTCPCPDCKSLTPREYRRDEPYSCNNTGCPANQIPLCVNNTCPVKKIVNQTEPLLVGNGFDQNLCGPSCKDSHLPDGECCTSSADMSGDVGRGVNPLLSISTLKEMCNTVGQLTNQINTLMAKMKQAVEEKDVGCVRKHCKAKTSKGPTPKQCFCPGNPRC